ncbi:MAG: methyltransferase domain-containing protein [Myxococcales bacterium]|nr:methyltransferase domain-containing protein [Myxococcales bacterium]
MDLDNYYRDHWIEIDTDRLARYDELFRLDPERAEKLLAPLELAPGLRVLDFGCGPGHVAAQIARLIGESGVVYGVDINADFVARARAVAAEYGYENRVTIHHASEERIPLNDRSVDRAFVKNVLEYVPDIDHTLGELARVLDVGGQLTAVDSDWGFVVVEPLSPAEVHELFLAAAPAFREPYVGRRLAGAFGRAGLSEVEVRVNAVVDRKGFLQTVLDNMLHYAESFGNISSKRADDFRSRLAAARESGDYLFVLPQFTVVGRRAG